MEVMVALYTSPGTHLIFDGRESRDLKTKRWDKVNINEDSFYLDIPRGKRLYKWIPTIKYKESKIDFTENPKYAKKLDE